MTPTQATTLADAIDSHVADEAAKRAADEFLSDASPEPAIAFLEHLAKVLRRYAETTFAEDE